MNQFFLNNAWILALLVLWSIPWKGVALWKAARSGSKPWFVVLLVVNTLGILEIIYIFAISKKEKRANKIT
ncbi:MAG: DUF5652 family protein [Candidatus Uhrbacteria bacterium]|nr:DUF5652 family protein [Candidatus Uhrbacteria bacterium]